MKVIPAQKFIEILKKAGISPFFEVPCSILKPLTGVLESDKDIDLIRPVSEGTAMGLAAGAYLSTGIIPMVMMQNSGLLNAANAITSLFQVYRIPVLLLVTWRGDPNGPPDAPEHEFMGKNLLNIIEAMKIPYRVLSPEGFERQLEEMMQIIRRNKLPGILVLKKGLIEGKKKPEIKSKPDFLSKLEAIRIVKEHFSESAVFISTNGFVSRESFNVVDTPDFYMVGSMGHALPIGISIARLSPKKVIVLDGDGGILMHIEAMASVAKFCPSNLIHFVFDNGCYASTGGQPTLSRYVDLTGVAKSMGYRRTYQVLSEKELKKIIGRIAEEDGPYFVRVMVSQDTKSRLSRITDKYSCFQIRDRFMSIFIPSNKQV